LIFHGKIVLLAVAIVKIKRKLKSEAESNNAANTHLNG